MNRAAVVAILAAAGGVACAPPPPPPTLTIYWRFVGAQGQPYGDGTQRNPGCVAANVDEVHMVVLGPGGYVVDDYRYPCLYQGVPGIFYDGIVSGPYTWQIYGVRQGLAVYYAEGVTNVSDAALLTVPVLADFPDLNVTYSLPTGVTCASNFTGFPLGQVDFQFQGAVAPYVVEYSGTNLLVTCQDPPNNTFVMPSIPPGMYQMAFLSALTPTTIPPAAAYQACIWPVTQADVMPAGSSPVTIPLTRATGPCY